MNAAERLKLGEMVFKRSINDEEKVCQLIRILLNGQKVNHLTVKTTASGPMKTDIAITLNGVEFSAKQVTLFCDKYAMDVMDDYGERRITEKQPDS